MSRCDVTFQAMGSQVRLIIEEPRASAPDPAHAALEAQGFIERFNAKLSRFRPDSELCAMNADPRPVVRASSLLRAAVRAGVHAAELSGGLVDPTLVHELEAAGYVTSRAGVRPASLKDALLLAPARQPARPRADGAWRRIYVDDHERTIHRPSGVAFDTGGTGKGLAADLLARRLGDYGRFVVDCGGDIRTGGFAAKSRPFDVEVENPLTGERAHVVTLSSGGIATSGLNVRLWKDDRGRFAHHLLDPSTGEPAWTGLIGATALGDTALEAETLSKAALLSGPELGRRFLSRSGGLLVHDSGEVELLGPLNSRRRMQITVPRALVDHAGAGV
jgi:thiamine biosynthesis lipoprotein